MYQPGLDPATSLLLSEYAIHYTAVAVHRNGQLAAMKTDYYYTRDNYNYWPVNAILLSDSFVSDAERTTIGNTIPRLSNF